MKDGVRLRRRNLRQRRVGSNYVVELLVVDVKWFSQQGLCSHTRPNKQLRYGQYLQATRTHIGKVIL
jgi:hypothetical protein